MTPPLDEELQANAAQIRALQAELKAARALRTRLGGLPLDVELQENTEEVRYHEDALKAAKTTRTRLILRAIGLGWRQVRIAELTGLDRSRIHQMVYAEKEEDQA